MTDTASACPQWPPHANTVAIMQPYAFPYLGYFNLVQACGVFVFYDDVNFITRGWINRNRVLVNGQAHQFSIPLSGASQNKRILDVGLHDFGAFRNKFLKQLKHAYRHAPCYGSGLAYAEEVLSSDYERIADLAIASVKLLFRKLGVERRFLRSSEAFPASVGAGRSGRLIDITKALGASHYVNPASGVSLYDKPHFEDNGVALSFLQPLLPEYRQVGPAEFVPGLSIIDVLMHNDHDSVRQMLSSYRLQ